jgi:molybdenum cofactor cytidylyltransferase
MTQSEEQSLFQFGVIILGAGASARMGRPKLLLPWGNTSVLGHLVGQWSSLGAKQVALACAEGNQPLDQELARLGFPARNRIVNPNPEAGMFSSIQCAARWPGWDAPLTHWVIVLGDQPHLRPETLRGLLEFAAGNRQRICQPGRNGRPRHPVIVPQAIFQELKQAKEDDLKQFLRNRPQEMALCELDDSGLDFDIDEPADYERAVRLFLPGSD